MTETKNGEVLEPQPEIVTIDKKRLEALVETANKNIEYARNLYREVQDLRAALTDQQRKSFRISKIAFDLIEAVVTGRAKSLSQKLVGRLTAALHEEQEEEDSYLTQMVKMLLVQRVAGQNLDPVLDTLQSMVGEQVTEPQVNEPVANAEEG